MKRLCSVSILTALFALLACLLAPAEARAQQRGQGMPAPSSAGRSVAPRVLSDNRVVFEVRAPAATLVQVNLGRVYDMKKGESGVWTVTTDPQQPGFHYYSLVIDGVNVADPAVDTFFGSNWMSSGIEIPGADTDFYAIKDVPHGEIRSQRYFSKYTNTWRTLTVYAPPGYDTDTARKYPVLYLQHGGGEDETGWAKQGKTDIILDNLIAAGKATPMLVVMANGTVPGVGGARGGYSSAGMAGFGNELLNNIVPFIESHYRVLAGARNRALAGLSMGGGQAFFVGLEHRDTFAHVGVFSTGLFGGIASPAGGAAGFDAEAQVPGILTKPESFNRSLAVFYISVGEQDPRVEFTKKAVADFKAHGLKVEFASFPGSHEWPVWRQSLRDFAQRIFR